MTQPKVSILVPSFKPRWFEEALCSAVNQTWRNKEIIVSDDCPSDEIRQICSRYSSKVVYRRNPNPGRAGFNNMLSLLALAGGEYIKYLFDDDVLESGCVEKLALGLEHNTQCGMAFSLRRVIDEHSREMRVNNYFGNSPSGYVSTMDVCRFISLNCINPIGEFSTVLFRTSHFRLEPISRIFNLNGRDPKSQGDVAVFLNMGASTPVFYYVNEILSSFRVHETSNSARTSDVFIPSITEWLDAMRMSVERGIVSHAEALAATEHFRKKWSAKYPNSARLQSVVRETAQAHAAWLRGNA